MKRKVVVTGVGAVSGYAIERTLERWKGRGVRLALVVSLEGEEARAEGWSR